MLEAGRTQHLLRQVLHVGQCIVVRQLGRMRKERGIRLDGQLVGGKMRRSHAQARVEVGARAVERLARQAVHEVDVDVADGFHRQGDRAPRLVGRVNAPECLEHCLVEALRGAGIRLQRNFRVGFHLDSRAHRAEQRIDLLGREQAGRAAAHEDAGEPASPDRRQQRLEIAQQCGDVFRERQLALALVRIEVAVGALLHAPGQVHVERERRQRGEANLAHVAKHGRAHRACSRSSSLRSAWPRWLMRFFSSGASSAAVLPSAGR